jgi:signal transduction histidine kinase
MAQWPLRHPVAVAMIAINSVGRFAGHICGGYSKMSRMFANIYATLARGDTDAAVPGWQLTPTRKWAVAEGSSEPWSDLSLGAHLLLPVAIFVTSMLSIEFSHTAHFVGTLWASNAIILVALMRYRRNLANYSSIVLGGALASALAGIIGGDTPALVAILTAINIGEVALALFLLSLFNVDASNLASFRNLLIFMGVAGGLAPLAGATASAFAFAPAHNIPWVMVWRKWFSCHGLGMVIVGPFLISITSREWNAIRFKQRLPEAAAIFVLFVAIGICAAYFRLLIFVLAPAILITTIRFGLIGATFATFVVTVISSAFVLLGIGQPILPQPLLEERLLALQAFLAITSFWSLPTAALLAERDRLLDGLSRANAQLQADSERKSHLVVGLRRHLSMAEEKERLRLSHELHDQAGQSLIAAILELNEIDPLIEATARDRLHLVRKKMEDMGKTLHRIAWELRPPAIDELGLRRALSSYVTDWGERCAADTDFHCDDPGIDEVPAEVATAVYRAVQEGLTNIVKHAQRPSSVSVVIRRSDTSLQLIIEDNGCGFDSGTPGAKPNSHRGLGLDGMRERLLLVGGTLEIESTPGTGTTLFVRIALDGQRSAA